MILVELDNETSKGNINKSLLLHISVDKKIEIFYSMLRESINKVDSAIV